MSRRLVPGVLAAFALALAAWPGAAAGSDRDQSLPVAWSWHHGLSAAKLRAAAREEKARIVDIEVEQREPLRFTAALVRNSGHTYKREWRWLTSASASDVKRAGSGCGNRLVDVERIGDDVYSALVL